MLTRAALPLVFAIGKSTSAAGRAHTVDQRTRRLRLLQDEAQHCHLPILFVTVGEHLTTRTCPDCRFCSPKDAQYLRRPSGGKCLRLLQCQGCESTRHRDAAAASNIRYVAWHQVEYGRHPFVAQPA